MLQWISKAGIAALVHLFSESFDILAPFHVSAKIKGFYIKLSFKKNKTDLNMTSDYIQIYLN
ncbi:hypothetical protein MASR2M29_14590 [Spirochaetota bacterium]